MKTKERKQKRLKYLSLTLSVTMFTAFIPFANFSSAATDTEENISGSSENLTNGILSDTPQEIKSMRTENSKTYLNPDGTYTSEISQDPIHFKNENNQWETIDNDLTINAQDGSVQNKANQFTVKFDQQPSVNQPIIKIEDESKSAALSLEPLENTGEKPKEVDGVVKDNSIQYPNVYSNIDLHYKVGSDRVKEDIVYKEKPSNGFPTEFTYSMDLDGYKVKEEAGIIYLLDSSSDKPVYFFETPSMYDSYKPKGFSSLEGVHSIPEEAISYDVKLNYEVVGNQLLLHLVPSKDWLEDSNRVYPITIDPTIVRIQSSNYVDDTNIRSAVPAQTGGNDLEIGGGVGNGNAIRSLLKFDLASVPADTTILSSSLDLYFSSTNSDTPINLNLYELTRDWNENEASWNYAKISPSTAWTTKGGDFNTTKLASVSGLTSPTTMDNELKKWEVSPSLIQKWKENTGSNYGFILKSDTESTNIYKKFISSENSVDEKYHPKLVITYRTNARLGLEDYWLYDSHQLVGGTSYSNLTTDNNVIQYEDFSLTGRGGFGLDFKRTYNSKSKERSGMGYGWTFTGNEKLYLNIKGTANIPDYQDEDGTDLEFTYNGTKAIFESGPGKYLTIKKDSNDPTIYTMTDKYGIKTNFKIMESNNDTNVKVAYIISKVDTHGNNIQYNYNDQRQLTSINADVGQGIDNSINFEYYDTGYIKSVSYKGTVFSFTYDTDGSGRIKAFSQLKDADENVSSTTSFGYQNGLISRITDPKGRQIDYTYQNGYLVKVQDPQVVNGVTDPDNRPGTVYNVNTGTKVSTVTQPEGDVTTYYTDSNYVINKKIENGITTDYTLDSNYNTLTVSEDGDVTTNTYDVNGNLTSTINPEQYKESYTYTTFSNIKTSTDVNNNVTSYTYKPNGDLDTIVYPDGGKETYIYNIYGDLQTITYPDGSVEKTSVDYSTNNKVIINTDANGNQTKNVEDYNGNHLSQTDGNGNTYSYEHNSKNEVISVTDPSDEVQKTRYTYDENGNLNSILDKKAHSETYRYDGQNKLTSEKDALGQQITYKYDNNGNLTDKLSANGDLITFSYDNNLGTVKSASVNGLTKWSYTYDELNQLKTVYEGSSTGTTSNILKSFTYDNDGSVATVTDRGNLLEYTDLGKDQKAQYKVGSGVTTLIYSLNSMDNIAQVTRNNDSAPLVSFKYESSGNLNAINYKNGSEIGMTYLKGRLDKYVLKKNSTQNLNTYTYSYDANNNITDINANNGTTNYTYNKLNELTKEILPDGTSISYTYDAVGNRISKDVIKSGSTVTTSYDYNENNQLILANGVIYKYDKNGNLQDDGTNTYVFNAFNQLEEVKDLQGKTVAQYTYDEDGKRISSRTSKGIVKYFYDGNKVLYETDGLNRILREYTYDKGGHISTMTTSGKTYYYLYNQHGDIIALTDEKGDVVASYTYDSWGNILSQSGELADVNPYRYAGYRYDNETGLYYLTARYYNSDLGRFISKDTFHGFQNRPLSINKYAYAENNPVMNNDPDGDMAAALVGVYVIPGIGEVALLGTGAVVVGGIAWGVGSWLGKKVRSYFNSQKITSSEADKIAKKKGYKSTNYKSHGARVYENKKAPRKLRYISRDTEGHIGGAFKGADTIKNLGSKSTRSGTYNKNLKRIGK
ncbi:DNRLRE domain-containing protein [Priestia koreensis]|uniref:DNRLRE domain-containing protein n=1 Tax=Priestia koreensis TaxID=284581 RepID=UPI00203D4585|nr:DNRLRE domain-containing protein [Priestia koreensis]MCM3005799.1 DNRLRE domain-containing protein [Priestia koreensis]